MKLPGRAYPVVGAATAAAVLLALSGPAQGAVSTGWRVVFTHHYGAATNNSVYTAVVATGRSDAWAFGVDNWVNPSSGSPVAEHWNGSGWRSSTLPPGLTSTIYAASAASPGDVWAVTRFGGDLLHWDGSTWSVAKHLTGTGELTGVTAFGPADVWAFGGGGAFPGLGTWHFNGQTWAHVAGNAAGVFSASAVSPTDMWAIGSIKFPGDAVVNYNGTSWQHVTAPALAGLGFQQILAESATDVWVTATLPTNGSVWRILHFSNGRWRSVPLPFPATGLGYLALDGQGGLWLDAYTSHGSWVWHRSAGGQWSRAGVGPGELALIPGTTTVLGANGAAPGNAVVWADGPLG